MLSRLIGVLVVLLAFGGCAYLGVQEMVQQQRAGGMPIVVLPLLTVPLLLLGWLVVRVGRLFIGRWRYDYGDRTLGERRLAGLGAAAMAGAAAYLGVVLLVPSQHPDAALVAALKPACTGAAVVGAGDSHVSGPVSSHLVVLGSAGEDQLWTGYPPLEWKPASLADAELAACVSDEDAVALIETCQYINGPAIKRYSATRHVTLVEPGTGRVVAEYDVTDSPRQCMKTEQRDVTELHGRVVWEAVQARLASYAGCCAPQPTASPARPGEQAPVTPAMTAPPMPTPAMPVEPTAPPMPVEPEVPVQPETPVP